MLHWLVMASPLLVTYLVRKRAASPSVGISCPLPLQNELLLNGMEVIDAMRDGNCGLDAFWKSLKTAAAPGTSLYATRAFKSFLPSARDSADAAACLRKKACT